MIYRIIDASDRHLGDLERLEQACFSLPWTREQLLAEFPDEQHEFLVAEDREGKAIAYVGMMHVLDEGYISNVAVSPSCRRQGIADALIAQILQRAGRWLLPLSHWRCAKAIWQPSVSMISTAFFRWAEERITMSVPGKTLF